MSKSVRRENALAAIRISSVKQGLQGDSPEDQKEQIKRFAENHNINVKKFFIFMESTSREEQPVQEAIDYCKNPKNDIQLFIVKSIDRFTRGGSYLYAHLKRQLDKYDVKLIDIYGIISSQEVNTLEHLGVEYDWSVYSPTKKSEILEAERAKDEMRDIMTRMIGAEIRYVRMGYRVRQAPFGYKNKKVETSHGKRVILKPHPEESKWILKMYELRVKGTLSDEKVVKEINKLGFKSRKQYKRDPKDKTKIIGQRGKRPLVLKQFRRYVGNPIYAGISTESWTQGKPVKGNFDGLVTIEMFNKANKGKVIISEVNGEVTIQRRKPPDWQLNKSVRNPDYPYKRYVMCPICNKPLYGSASRGKLGKYYPAYHCNKRGHYFRVPKKEFEDTIKSFVSNLDIKPKDVEKLKNYILDLWNKQKKETQKDKEQIEDKIKKLGDQADVISDKFKYLTSEAAIKRLEKELVTIENEIKKLEAAKTEKSTKKDENMEIALEFIGYFLEHLEELILGSPNPLKRAAFFGLIFEKPPNYEELVSGTPKLAPFLGLKGGKRAPPDPDGAPGRT